MIKVEGNRVIRINDYPIWNLVVERPEPIYCLNRETINWKPQIKHVEIFDRVVSKIVYK